MADEMDTCEYIWNHELAMRRLLSLVGDPLTDNLMYSLLYLDSFQLSCATVKHTARTPSVWMVSLVVVFGIVADKSCFHLIHPPPHSSTRCCIGGSQWQSVLDDVRRPCTGCSAVRTAAKQLSSQWGQYPAK